MTDVIAIARTPAEMEQAQTDLIDWARAKLEMVRNELNEAQESLKIAKQSKWNVTRWQAVVSRARRRMIFYTKVKRALEAGYYIVPPFPVDVFAVRTDRAQPSGSQTSSYGWIGASALDQKPRRLPEGEGEYVAAEPEVWITDLSHIDSEGKKVSKYRHYAKEFRDVDFPFTFAKPQLLEQVSKAMKEKIFDQFGVLPKYERKGDPIVVGQILHPNQYRSPITFFVGWWLDTKDI